MELKIKKTLERGNGPATVIVHEAGNLDDNCQKIIENLQLKGRTLVLEAPRINSLNWTDVTQALLAALRESTVRYASFIAIGDAGVLIQNLGFQQLKLIKKIILINPTTCPHPGLFEFSISKIEQFFPLGLPLRSRSKLFDSRAYLHSIRCPVLIIVAQSASKYFHQQAEILAHLLPTAWLKVIDFELSSAELISTIEEFQNVASKCPQKKVA